MEKAVKEILILRMQKEIESLQHLEDHIKGTRLELERQVREYTGQKQLDEVLEI